MEAEADAASPEHVLSALYIAHPRSMSSSIIARISKMRIDPALAARLEADGIIRPAGGGRFVLSAQSFEPDPGMLADMRGRLVKWASISLEKAAGSNRYKALYEFEEDLLCAVRAALDEKKESAAVRLCARVLALLYRTRNWDETHALATKMLHVAREAQMLPEEISILGSLGNALYYMERFEESVISYIDAIQLSQKCGLGIQEARWTGSLADSLHRMGRNKHALKACRSAIRTAQNSGSDTEASVWYFLAGRICRSLGMKSEADVYFSLCRVRKE